MEERNFIVYGDSALQMFHWLTPYIEQAGYIWKVFPIVGQISSWQISIQKHHEHRA
jgi:hypothetical protein